MSNLGLETYATPLTAGRAAELVPIEHETQ